MIKRLGRFLCNGGWLIQYPETIISHLPRIGSDHRPLLLSVPCNIISAPTPLFHYLVVWQTHLNFDSFLEKVLFGGRDINSNLTNFTRKV